MPGGVVNIVTGDRDHLVKTLVQHEDVDSVWYFGSAEGSYQVENESAANMKRTWTGYGLPRDWMDREQGEGHEFLHEATQVRKYLGTDRGIIRQLILLKERYHKSAWSLAFFQGS